MFNLEDLGYEELEDFQKAIVDELVHRAYTDGYENGKAITKQELKDGKDD